MSPLPGPELETLTGLDSVFREHTPCWDSSSTNNGLTPELRPRIRYEMLLLSNEHASSTRYPADSLPARSRRPRL